MKNRIKILTLFVISIVALSLIIGAKNSFSEELDPLVTQSYIEMRIEELKEYFKTQLEQTKGQANTSQNQDVSKYIRFVPIELKLGEELIGGEGSEIILRSGRAKSIANVEGGLLDATDGVDLESSQAIPLHHLIVIPRSDGRGFRVTSGNAFAMVKGPYEIK